MCPEGFRGTSTLIAASFAPSPGSGVRLEGVKIDTIVAVDVRTHVHF